MEFCQSEKVETLKVNLNFAFNYKPAWTFFLYNSMDPSWRTSRIFINPDCDHYASYFFHLIYNISVVSNNHKSRIGVS